MTMGKAVNPNAIIGRKALTKMRKEIPLEVGEAMGCQLEKHTPDLKPISSHSYQMWTIILSTLESPCDEY